MDTIASEVRLMFIRLVRDELIELHVRLEVLRKAELFDDVLKYELENACGHLSVARARAEDLGGGS